MVSPLYHHAPADNATLRQNGRLGVHKRDTARAHPLDNPAIPSVDRALQALDDPMRP